MNLNNNFWSGKRVLLTGHTGFKGGWLALWLQELGAEVAGISLPPTTSPNLFDTANIKDGISSHFCDIRKAEDLSKLVNAIDPQIVFHLAAQPLVRASYQKPLETFDTNVMGTANLLDALRSCKAVKVAVIVTTDKVYRNNEWLWPYREEDSLGGHDPYSASKAASELIISSYRDAFLADQGISIASARAGNVIGGGDWSEDRLLPDAIRAWQKGHVLEVRRPEAIRPWQHVLEPLSGYLKLAKKLWREPSLAGAYNFGPETSEAATVQNVIELARKFYDDAEILYGDGTLGPHEAGWLALEVAKARTILGIKPKWGLEESIQRTMSWYRDQQQGKDVRELCYQDILAFENYQ